MNARDKSPVREETGPRVAAIDWARVSDDLDDQGHAVIQGLLTPTKCESLAALYGADSQNDDCAGTLFRSRVVMERHGFGRGEYKYFAYPLPELIGDLRAQVYLRLVPIANRWNEVMGIDVRYPHAHAEFIARCHADGQMRPTPLLLQYGPDDYNSNT